MYICITVLGLRTAAHGLSLFAESGTILQLWYAGFSLWSLSLCGAQTLGICRLPIAAACGHSSCGTQAKLPCDGILPRPGIKPESTLQCNAYS